MSDVNFNAAEFMNETIDTQLDTKILPVPPGEHLGQIGTGEKDVDIIGGIIKNGPNAGKPWVRLDCMVYLTDPNLAAQLKREVVKVRYSVMLDLNEAGKLDTREQRNVNLGKLRDAVGQNQPGPWNYNQLKGCAIKVVVKQKPNENNPEEPYSEVVAVTKAR